MTTLRRVLGIIAVVASAWPAQAFAADPPAASRPAPSSTPAPALYERATPPSPIASPTDGIGRVAIYFIALIAVVGGGLYVLKNGLPLRGRIAGGDRKLQILETRMLGNRQFLVVVEYDDSKLLLGVTPGKIDYLCPLESRTSTNAEFPVIAAPEASRDSLT